MAHRNLEGACAAAVCSHVLLIGIDAMCDHSVPPAEENSDHLLIGKNGCAQYLLACSCLSMSRRHIVANHVLCVLSAESRVCVFAVRVHGCVTPQKDESAATMMHVLLTFSAAAQSTACGVVTVLCAITPRP